MKTEDITSLAAEIAANPETEQEASVPETKIAKKKTRKAKAAANARVPREGSKLETVGKMLRRKNGCTTKDVLEATGWPSVSMPQQAKALGVKLRTERVGKSNRYWAA